jgi:hypothetical protein
MDETYIKPINSDKRYCTLSQLNSCLLIMVLPTYNAIQFYSKEQHSAALYDACLLIVNTYNGSDMLDGYTIDNANGYMTAYDFMKYARNILNRIAEDTLQ